MTTRSDGAPDRVEQLELQDGRRIHGFVDQGYGCVMDAFVANFVERHDLGAGCTAYVAGRIVVDLWGGLADPRTLRPWEPDTAAVIFSCSKGILAICAYLLVQEGRLEFDAPIARYWPAFGRHGKAGTTVRQAMSHRAGVPCLDVDLRKDEVLAWDPVIRAIEEQRPLYPTAAGHVYHAMTYGWLLGEVIRRVTGLMPGRYFRAAIGDRLGLQTWIGIPNEARGSVAWMEPPLPDEDSDAAPRFSSCDVDGYEGSRKGDARRRLPFCRRERASRSENRATTSARCFGRLRPVNGCASRWTAVPWPT
jgi:CubicO group peptidase (beta-lactamase class C family)